MSGYLFVVVCDATFARLTRLRLPARPGAPSVTLLRPDTRTGGPRTVEGMATALVNRIRQCQPNGPFLLAGFSEEGTLAFEAAAQLAAADECVGLVGLVDCETGSDPDGRRERVSSRSTPLQRALLDYVLPLVSFPLTLCVGSLDGAIDPHLGWGCVTQPEAIERLEVPDGDADDLLRAQVTALLDAVDRSVRHAPPERRPAPPKRPRSSVVTLRPGSPRGSRVVCVPGAGATVADFLPLAAIVGGEHQVDGVQLRGVDADVSLPHPTVEAAARFHLPFLESGGNLDGLHLVGSSFGGWVAFEMATRLAESGHRVGSLTLLDSTPPDSETGVLRECTRTEALMEVVALLEERASKPLHIDPHQLADAGPVRQLELVHRRAVGEGLLSPRSYPRDLLGAVRGLESAMRTSYCPRLVYRGTANLVLMTSPSERAGERAERRAEATVGWRRSAPALQVVQRDGDHLDALSAADLLGDLLARRDHEGGRS